MYVFVFAESEMLYFAKLTFFSGTDPKQYLVAIADKEVKWTEQFGKPLECDFPHNTVFPGVNSHEDYLKLLKKYIKIAPYLLPKDSQSSLNKPTIRHPGMPPTQPLSLMEVRLILVKI